MSETKNDTEARAKREIAEEWAAYQTDHHVSSSYYAEIKGEWAEEKLIAERVKNLELRERVTKLIAAAKRIPEHLGRYECIHDIQEELRGDLSWFGTWPGDETDEDLQNAVKEVRKP